MDGYNLIVYGIFVPAMTLIGVSMAISSIKESREIRQRRYELIVVDRAHRVKRIV